MLRLRGCALLATAACFRFGGIMDILYWVRQGAGRARLQACCSSSHAQRMCEQVAPGSYVNTDRVEAVCEHTERVTRSSSALCVEAGNGTMIEYVVFAPRRGTGLTLTLTLTLTPRRAAD